MPGSGRRQVSSRKKSGDGLYRCRSSMVPVRMQSTASTCPRLHLPTCVLSLPLLSALSLNASASGTTRSTSGSASPPTTGTEGMASRASKAHRLAGDEWEDTVLGLC